MRKRTVGNESNSVGVGRKRALKDKVMSAVCFTIFKGPVDEKKSQEIAEQTETIGGKC